MRERWNMLLIVRTMRSGDVNRCALFRRHPPTEDSAVKAQVTSFDSLSPTDPLRLEFGRLHGRSFSVNAAVLLLGVVVVFITAFTMKV
jgi:hypothetical protein